MGWCGSETRGSEVWGRGMCVEEGCGEEECVGEKCVRERCAAERGVRKMYEWNRSAQLWCVCGNGMCAEERSV